MTEQIVMKYFHSTIEKQGKSPIKERYHMRIITTAALIICCYTATHAFTNFKRFMLKLKEFEYPQYTISDPSLNFNVSTYGTETNNNNFTENSGFSVQGNAEGAYKFTIIRPQYWLDVNTSLAIAGNYDKSERIVQGETNKFKDKALRASSTLHTQYELHPLGELLNNILFAGVTVDNWYMRDWRKTSSSEYTNDYDNLTGKAEIGASFRKPVRPLYAAFEIERKLKDAGVIADTLTSETLQDLSNVVITREKLILRHDIVQKFVMEQIEKVLIKDSLVDTTKLDAFALFKISEALDIQIPEIYTGFKMSLGVAGVGLWKPSGYYNPVTDHRGTDDYYKTVMELALSYTAPVCTRLFIYAELTKKATGEYEGFEHNFKYQVVNTRLHYIFTNRIIGTGGVNGIACKYFVPENQRVQSVFMELEFYLEDKVSLSLNGSRNFGGMSSSTKYVDPEYGNNSSFSAGMWLRFGL
ncbi:MAG TPA: hypothetical protein VKO63_00745 [Chitinispirillaceae bacterium]|nr:hypothetical protein [Chitinispirillaceae bacterium]